jgi:hypothetical protein
MRGGSRESLNATTDFETKNQKKEQQVLTGLKDTLNLLEHDEELKKPDKTDIRREYITHINKKILQQTQFLKNIQTRGYAHAKSIENNLYQRARRDNRINDARQPDQQFEKIGNNETQTAFGFNQHNIGMKFIKKKKTRNMP